MTEAKKKHTSKSKKTGRPQAVHQDGHLRSLLKSLVINVVILVTVLLTTPILYETNDDFGIAAKIDMNYPYIGFVNYYLCKALAAVQDVAGSWNVFMLSQMVFSFIAFVVILKVIIHRSKHNAVSLLAVVTMAVFSLDHYSSIQFTKTSALLMAAGLLLVADAFLHERHLLDFIIGFALLYVGVMYRERGMFPALAYAGLFVILWAILNGFQGFWQCKTRAAEVLLIGVLCVVALCPYGVDKLSDRMNASTEELAYARAYQAERVKITDYPTYDFYEQNRKAYDAAGLSENDIYLVDHWMLDYDGAASYENLQVINEINQPCVAADRSATKAARKFLRKTLKAMEKMDLMGIHIIIMVLLSGCILLLTRPKNWLYIIGFGGLTVFIYILLYYLGRPQYRAFYVADISACTWLLYALAQSVSVKGDGEASENSANSSAKAGSKNAGILKWVVTLACCAAMFAMLAPATSYINALYNNTLSKIESDTFVKFYQEHKDTFYVCSTSTKKRHPSYLNPLQVPVVERNATGMGGWGTLSPYELEQLEEYGMKNLVGDLINNDNVYYVGNKNIRRLTEYYNKWYAKEGKTIRFMWVDKVEDTDFYKVVEE